MLRLLHLLQFPEQCLEVCVRLDMEGPGREPRDLGHRNRPRQGAGGVDEAGRLLDHGGTAAGGEGAAAGGFEGPVGSGAEGGQLQGEGEVLREVAGWLVGGEVSAPVDVGAEDAGDAAHLGEVGEGGGGCRDGGGGEGSEGLVVDHMYN